MFSAMLGEFLLQERLIAPERLREILDGLDKVRLRIGVLAVNAGYMTAEQIDRVHEAQKSTDKRFGDLAVEMGFLSRAQMEELLAAQRYEHLVLGQALVDAGVFSMEEFGRILERYKRSKGLDDSAFEAVKRGDVDAAVRAALRGEEILEKELLVDYVALFVRNLIRFIDRNASFAERPAADAPLFPWTAYQIVFGPLTLFTAIAGEEGALRALGSRFAGEEMHEFGELAQASVEEYLNLVNGIFTVNMSNHGMELEMRPQTMARNFSPRGETPVFRIPLRAQAETFSLLLSESVPAGLSN